MFHPLSQVQGKSDKEDLDGVRYSGLILGCDSVGDRHAGFSQNELEPVVLRTTRTILRLRT